MLPEFSSIPCGDMLKLLVTNLCCTSMGYDFSDSYLGVTISRYLLDWLPGCQGLGL